jgi:hypothetical protein
VTPAPVGNQTSKTREEEGKEESVRLELLNLARGVAVVALPLALALGALRFVAEVHCRRRHRLATNLLRSLALYGCRWRRGRVV